MDLLLRYLPQGSMSLNDIRQAAELDVDDDFMFDSVNNARRLSETAKYVRNTTKASRGYGKGPEGQALQEEWQGLRPADQRYLQSIGFVPPLEREPDRGGFMGIVDDVTGAVGDVAGAVGDVLSPVVDNPGGRAIGKGISLSAQAMGAPTHLALKSMMVGSNAVNQLYRAVEIQQESIIGERPFSPGAALERARNPRQWFLPHPEFRIENSDPTRDSDKSLGLLEGALLLWEEAGRANGEGAFLVSTKQDAYRRAGYDSDRYWLAYYMGTGMSPSDAALRLARENLNEDDSDDMVAGEVERLWKLTEAPRTKAATKVFTYGHISPGRDFARAAGFNEAGTAREERAFDLISGGVDAIWRIRTDPLLLGGRALRGANLVRSKMLASRTGKIMESHWTPDLDLMAHEVMATRDIFDPRYVDELQKLNQYERVPILLVDTFKGPAASLPERYAQAKALLPRKQYRILEAARRWDMAERVKQVSAVDRNPDQMSFFDLMNEEQAFARNSTSEQAVTEALDTTYGRMKVGETAYHGSSNRQLEFVSLATVDRGSRRYKEWNTFVGTHVADTKMTADIVRDAHVGGPGGKVFKLNVNTNKIKHYNSEAEMSLDAIRRILAEGRFKWDDFSEEVRSAVERVESQLNSLAGNTGAGHPQDFIREAIGEGELAERIGWHFNRSMRADGVNVVTYVNRMEGGTSAIVLNPAADLKKVGDEGLEIAEARLLPPIEDVHATVERANRALLGERGLDTVDRVLRHFHDARGSFDQASGAWNNDVYHSLTVPRLRKAELLKNRKWLRQRARLDDWQDAVKLHDEFYRRMEWENLEAGEQARFGGTRQAFDAMKARALKAMGDTMSALGTRSSTGIIHLMGDDALNDFAIHMRGLQVRGEELERSLANFAAADNIGARRRVLHEATDSALRSLGLHETAMNQVNPWYSAWMHQMGVRYQSYSLVKGLDEAGIGTLGQRKLALYGPDMADDLVMMPSYRELRTELSKARTSMFIERAINAPLLDKFMERVWKPYMILRIGFVPRVIVDELLPWIARDGWGAPARQWLTYPALRAAKSGQVASYLRPLANVERRMRNFSYMKAFRHKWDAEVLTSLRSGTTVNVDDLLTARGRTAWRDAERQFVMSGGDDGRRLDSFINLPNEKWSKRFVAYHEKDIRWTKFLQDRVLYWMADKGAWVRQADGKSKWVGESIEDWQKRAATEADMLAFRAFSNDRILVGAAVSDISTHNAGYVDTPVKSHGNDMLSVRTMNDDGTYIILPQRAVQTHFVDVTKGDPAYINALVYRLGQMAEDPAAKVAAAFEQANMGGADLATLAFAHGSPIEEWVGQNGRLSTLHGEWTGLPRPIQNHVKRIITRGDGAEVNKLLDGPWLLGAPELRELIRRGSDTLSNNANLWAGVTVDRSGWYHHVMNAESETNLLGKAVLDDPATGLGSTRPMNLSSIEFKLEYQRIRAERDFIEEFRSLNGGELPPGVTQAEYNRMNDSWNHIIGQDAGIADELAGMDISMPAVESAAERHAQFLNDSGALWRQDDKYLRGALRETPQGRELDDRLVAWLDRVAAEGVTTDQAQVKGLLDEIEEIAGDIWHFNSRVGGRPMTWANDLRNYDFELRRVIGRTAWPRWDAESPEEFVELLYQMHRARATGVARPDVAMRMRVQADRLQDEALVNALNVSDGIYSLDEDIAGAAASTMMKDGVRYQHTLPRNDRMYSRAERQSMNADMQVSLPQPIDDYQLVYAPMIPRVDRARLLKQLQDAGDTGPGSIYDSMRLRVKSELGRESFDAEDFAAWVDREQDEMMQLVRDPEERWLNYPNDPTQDGVLPFADSPFELVPTGSWATTDSIKAEAQLRSMHEALGEAYSAENRHLSYMYVPNTQIERFAVPNGPGNEFLFSHSMFERARPITPGTHVDPAELSADWVNRLVKDVQTGLSKGARRNHVALDAVASGRVTSWHEANIPQEILPDVVGGPLHELDLKAHGLWNRFVQFGFEKGVGPLVDGFIRMPMFHHKLGPGVQEARALLAPFMRDEALEQVALTALGSGRRARLGIDEYEDLAIQVDSLMSGLRGHRGLPGMKMDNPIEQALAVGRDPELSMDLLRWTRRRNEYLPPVFDDYLERFEQHLEQRLRAARVNDATPAELRKLEQDVFDNANRRLKDIDTAQETWRRFDSMANEAAARRALDETAPFVDDHRIRSQTAEVLRNIIPFYWATEQTMRRWVTSVAANPVFIHELQLGMHGLRSMGVVRKDQYGNDIFTYPGSQALQEVVSRVPVFGELGRVAITIPLTGQVAYAVPFLQDLGMPAPGPLLTTPLRLAAEVNPEFEGLRDMVVPEGSEENLWLNDLLPPVVSRALRVIAASPDRDRDVAAAQYQTIAMMEQTNIQLTHAVEDAEDDLNQAMRSGTNEDQREAQRRFDEAVEARNEQGVPGPNATDSQIEKFLEQVANMTRVMLTAKLILGFVGPVAPRADVEVPMSQEYRNLMRELGPGQALTMFLKRHPDMSPFTIFQTDTDSGAPLGASAPVEGWLDDNRQMLANYQHAGPWLAPSGDGEPFSYKAYLQTIASGYRRRISADEAYRQMKFRQAAPDYFEMRDDFELAIAREADSTRRSEIEDEWAAWRDEYLTIHRTFATKLRSQDGEQRRQNVIREMDALIDDGRYDVGETENVRPLVTLWRRYESELAKLGDSQSERSQERRLALRAQTLDSGDALAEDDPSVKALWRSVYREELDPTDLLLDQIKSRRRNVLYDTDLEDAPAPFSWRFGGYG